jgi:hypothetical protein
MLRDYFLNVVAKRLVHARVDGDYPEPRLFGGVLHRTLGAPSWAAAQRRDRRVEGAFGGGGGVVRELAGKRARVQAIPQAAQAR